MSSNPYGVSPEELEKAQKKYAYLDDYLPPTLDETEEYTPSPYGVSPEELEAAEKRQTLAEDYLPPKPKSDSTEGMDYMPFDLSKMSKEELEELRERLAESQKEDRGHGLGM